MDRSVARSARGLTKPFYAIIVVVALVAAWLPLGAIRANAVGTFQDQDGNMIGTPDWQSVASSPKLMQLTDKASGNSDDSFTGGSTKNNDTTIQIGPSSVPGKTDLTRAYIYPDGQYLYLAWERASSTGDAHIDFEINAKEQSWPDATVGNTTATVDRTPGDLLISYDWAGSGAPDITLRTWTGSVWGPSTDLSASGYADGAVNTTTIFDPIAGTNVPAEDFGEAGIDMIGAGIYHPVSCTYFGSVTVKSRASGSSDTSQLKDYIAPQTVSVSNCGKIIVKKKTTPSAGTGFDFTADFSNGEFKGATPVTIGDGGTLTSDLMPPGDYTVTESAKTGWTLGSLSCSGGSTDVTKPPTATITLAAGDTVTCTYNNVRDTGTLEVIKQVSSIDPSESGKFNLQIDASIKQSDVGDGGTTGAVTVYTGTHTVGETAGQNTDLNDYSSDISCATDGGPSTAYNTNVTVGKGQAVVCTITNTRKTGTLQVKKVLDPADPGLFDLKIGSTTVASAVGNGGQSAAVSVPTGSYTVSEAAANTSPTSLTDYTAAISCDDPSKTSASTYSVSGVAVGDGANVVCTITNTRQAGTLTVVKACRHPIPASSTSRLTPAEWAMKRTASATTAALDLHRWIPTSLTRSPSPRRRALT